MASGKSLELRKITRPDPIVINDPEKVAEFIDGELHEGYFFAQKWRRNREWRRGK
jgi:hypothetical protein